MKWFLNYYITKNKEIMADKESVRYRRVTDATNLIWNRNFSYMHTFKILSQMKPQKSIKTEKKNNISS